MAAVEKPFVRWLRRKTGSWAAGGCGEAAGETGGRRAPLGDNAGLLLSSAAAEASSSAPPPSLELEPGAAVLAAASSTGSLADIGGSLRPYEAPKEA